MKEDQVANAKVWNKGCVTRWWLQCEHYLWEFEKELKLKTSQSTPFVVRMANQKKV
jgi:hypothetical protein